MKIITQSFIKSLFKYKEGKACGLQFEAQFINNIEFPSSDAMNLGSWFEYMCTGQTTKFGHIPEPTRLKAKKLTKAEIESGMKQEDQIGELSKKYKDALCHVEAFKQMIEACDYEIVATGERIVDKELGIQGDVDITVRKRGDKDGRVIFIDTKFSGLLDNKWDERGWADESLEYKHDIMIQAVHYKLLGFQKYGYEPDFFFWVFSSTNTTDRKNIRVNVDSEYFGKHQASIVQARQAFEAYKAKGWIARPKPKRCGNCPLRDKCPHFISLPVEQTVFYGG
tara:strand:- start:1761 stop:2603 length:843 start_codon:yes stop_codon:yes gene_type:complete